MAGFFVVYQLSTRSVIDMNCSQGVLEMESVHRTQARVISTESIAFARVFLKRHHVPTAHQGIVQTGICTYNYTQINHGIQK